MTSTPFSPSPQTMGETETTVVVAADLRADMPARTRRIHKPQVTRRPFSRLSAPAFDPALATRNPGR